MTRERLLAGAAHDIAHHAGSGVSWLSPHMAVALRKSGVATVSFDVLAPDPYPAGVVEVEPLRLALASLRDKAQQILSGYGFLPNDISGVELSVTPAPWDETGYTLHTRAVVTSSGGRPFDSGWLGLS